MPRVLVDVEAERRDRRRRTSSTSAGSADGLDAVVDRGVRRVRGRLARDAHRTDAVRHVGVGVSDRPCGTAGFAGVATASMHVSWIALLSDQTARSCNGASTRQHIAGTTAPLSTVIALYCMSTASAPIARPSAVDRRGRQRTVRLVGRAARRVARQVGLAVERGAAGQDPPQVVHRLACCRPSAACRLARRRAACARPAWRSARR